MAQPVVKRGSVVVIRYPFTELTGAKVRPALVATPDHLLPRLEDVLCLFISAAIPADLLPTDFVLEPGIGFSGHGPQASFCAQNAQTRIAA